MNFKKISIVVLVLVLFGVFIAYKMYNKPHTNIADQKADITLTADIILKDFSSDENIANTKYLEKIIEVAGSISEVKIEKGKGIIVLKTNDDFGSVICHLSNKATKNIHSLKVGKTISIKGICTGYLMDVILVKCEITN